MGAHFTLKVGHLGLAIALKLCTLDLNELGTFVKAPCQEMEAWI
jgi:hypothetical protein